MLEQEKRRIVRPVEIVQKPYQRRLLAQSLHECLKAIEEVALLLLWRKLYRNPDIVIELAKLRSGNHCR